MPRPPRLGAALALALALAACAGPQAPPPPTEEGGGRVSAASRARALPVAANRGVLRGELLVPVAGVVANNGAKLVANNGGGVLTNHGAGLVGNHAAGFRLAQVAKVEPAADVEVLAYDLAGRRVEGGSARTDAKGRFELRGLGSSAAVLVLKAGLERDGRKIELQAMVAAPRDGVIEGVKVDPATSLVARKVGALIERDAVDPAALRADGLAAAAEAIAPTLGEAELAIAVAGGTALAAQALDDLLARHEGVRGEVGRAAGAAVARTLPTPPPDAPAGPASPAPVTSAAPLVATGSEAPAASPAPADPAASPAPSAAPSAATASAAPSEGPPPSPSPSVAASVAPTAAPSSAPTALPSAPATAAPEGTMVTTLAGDGTPGEADGIGAAATFDGPEDLAFLPGGDLIVADKGSSHLRRVTTTGKVLTALAGDGEHFDVDDLETLAVDAAGRLYSPQLLLGDVRMRRITLGGQIEVFAGLPNDQAAYGAPRACAFGPEGKLYYLAGNDLLNVTLRAIGTNGADEPVLVGGDEVVFPTADPEAIAFAPDGTAYACGGNRVYRWRAGGQPTVFAGAGSGYVDATGPAARFDGPSDLAVAPDGSVVVADTDNHRIRRISAEGKVTTVAGGAAGFTNGAGLAARFNEPLGVAVAADGTIYVADGLNHAIRKIAR